MLCPLKRNEVEQGAEWPERLVCPAVCEAHSDQGAFESRPAWSEEGSAGDIGGRVFPAEGTASANGLGWDGAGRGLSRMSQG